jgi:hypoxanthine phosphoribosyltransferase
MQPKELISAATIAARVAQLAREIDQALPPGPLTVVGVLRGAFIFMADLVRAIPREMTCDFLGVRSYGDATVSSGVVEITSDLTAPVAGRHVLLVEDIADTGLTLRYLLELLTARGPASVHTCVLLSKPFTSPAPGPKGGPGVPLPAPARPAQIDFVGFEAPNAFVVGYGLDAGQLYRNLPYVGVLEVPGE